MVNLISIEQRYTLASPVSVSNHRVIVQLAWHLIAIIHVRRQWKNPAVTFSVTANLFGLVHHTLEARSLMSPRTR